MPTLTDDQPLSLGRLVVMTFLTATVAFGGSFVAATAGSVQGSIVLGILLRGVAGVSVVALAAFWHSSSQAGILPTAGVAVASYLVNPLSWSGKALFGQLIDGPVVAFVLDGVVWVGLFVGVAWGRRRLLSSPS